MKIKIASAILSVAALTIGIVASVWFIILENHHWNHYIFRENHYYDGIIGGLSIALISLIVFLACYYFLKRNLKNKLCKILSNITFALYNIAAIVLIIIIVVHASLDLGSAYKDYSLDCQLASNDNVKLHEAVDSVIARSDNDALYNEDEINQYMMKAARNGYAPAQNYVGVYFHEKAKKDKYEYDRYLTDHYWNVTETPFHNKNLTRATYWWLKAAKQNHGRAQENLGRLMMRSILSDQPYSFGEAKFWLTEAAKNGVVSAYYYLGLLYEDSSLNDAAQYWRIGAEKGNEKCKIKLENPDFIDITITNLDQ